MPIMLETLSTSEELIKFILVILFSCYPSKLT